LIGSAGNLGQKLKADFRTNGISGKIKLRIGRFKIIANIM
jgi:hypothetical protein